MHQEIVIRSCTTQELSKLAYIETRADTLFPEELIPADESNYPLTEFRKALDKGSLLVAAVEDQIVGFAVAEGNRKNYHLYLIAVLPEWGRKGIGSALVAAIADEARNREMQQLTLTTFLNIEWNAPFYKKLGFKILKHEECNPLLRNILHQELELGFTDRVAMALIL